MTVPILLKRSINAGELPQPSELQAGELAINAVDCKLFTKNVSGQIVSLNNSFSFNGRTGNVTLGSSDVTNALGYVPYNSTNPNNYISTAPVLSVNGKTGAVQIVSTDITGFAKVASTGNYGDLLQKPNLLTSTSQLVNDSGFITSLQAPVQSVNSQTGIVNLSLSQIPNDAGYLSTQGNGSVTLASPNISLFTNDVGYVTPAQKGSPFGVATLDTNARLPINQTNLTSPIIKIGDYTFVQTDHNNTYYGNSTSATTYTVPSLPIGTKIKVIQGNTGKISYANAVGITINCATPSVTGTRTRYSQIEFQWITTTTVVVSGDLG